ncbi:hypothetical protein L345_18566, partial [Ophiophagus hannah]
MEGRKERRKEGRK